MGRSQFLFCTCYQLSSRISEKKKKKKRKGPAGRASLRGLRFGLGKRKGGGGRLECLCFAAFLPFSGQEKKKKGKGEGKVSDLSSRRLSLSRGGENMLFDYINIREVPEGSRLFFQNVLFFPSMPEEKGGGGHAFSLL